MKEKSQTSRSSIISLQREDMENFLKEILHNMTWEENDSWISDCLGIIIKLTSINLTTYKEVIR